MDSFSLMPLDDLYYRKSNLYLGAKLNSNLLENKIMSIALARIEINATGGEEVLEARLFPGELKRLFSDPNHITRDLEKVATTIVGHTIMIQNGKDFKVFSVVPNATFENGIFTIKFNSELRDHVLELENHGNYSTLELATMVSFTKNSSFRMYELLKKEAYLIPKATKTNPNPCVRVVYGLSELKFIIGLANIDDDNVKHAIAAMGKNVDWDALYNKLDKKDKKYEEWRDFQRNVLKPAQKELIEKSDIRFEYTGERDSHKISRLIFTIYNNTPTNSSKVDLRKQILEENSVSNRQLEMPYDIYPELYDELIGHNGLDKEDISLLLYKAGENPDKVREAVKMVDEYSNNHMVNNYMGALVDCLANWKKGKKVLEGSTETAQVVDDIIDSYEKSDKESIAQMAWERIKQKKEFKNFSEDVQSDSISIEQLEVIYSYQELVKMFTDWTVGKL